MSNTVLIVPNSSPKSSYPPPQSSHACPPLIHARKKANSSNSLVDICPQMIHRTDAASYTELAVSSKQSIAITTASQAVVKVHTKEDRAQAGKHQYSVRRLN